MEKIFTKFHRKTFAKEMKDYFQESKEAFGDLYEVDVLSYIVSEQLLTYLFSHTKSLEKACWSTATMLKYMVRIARTREVLFLLRDNEYMQHNDLKRFMQHKDPYNMLLLAGGTLYYYYNLYERPFHSEAYNQKTDQMWDMLVHLPDNKNDPDGSRADNSLPVVIKRSLDEEVFGQEEAKKILSMAVAGFVKKGIRTPVMFVGPTGCGKTHMIQKLSQIPELRDKVYIHFYNATELTATGFSGDNLKEILKEFSARLQGRKGIFVFDEIDKRLAYGSADRNGNDVNQTIIHDMLTAISGNASNYAIDTNKILFIFLGAFENLEDDRKRQMKTMGFTGSRQNTTKPYDIRTELIKKGCSRQFLGRIGRIVMMEDLDRTTIRRIFVDENHGVLPRKQDEFSLWGLSLEWDDTYLESAISEVAASDQGARYITTIVEKTIGTADYEMLENGNHNMLLSEETLYGRKPNVR